MSRTAFLIVFLCSTAAIARDVPTLESPARFLADTVQYDDQKRMLTARGDVEIWQENGRKVTADTMEYARDTGKVTARGHVRITESTGETLTADRITLTEDLKQGFLQGVEVRLADQSRLKAATATREAGGRNILTTAAFTPCKVCAHKPPLWELRAKNITHDEQKQEITYKDAWLDVLGQPLLWVPYFSHPDPTLKRKSGFLAPSMGRSKEKGLIIQTPFYYAWAPWQDLTLTPMLMSDAGGILSSEYRQRLSRGMINLKASGGVVDKLEKGEKTGKTSRQGHIDIQAATDLNQHWRAGLSAARTSDRVYLRRFDLDDRDILTSRLFTERFEGEQYFRARALSFQGLRRLDDNDTAPLILPELDFRGRTKPLQWPLRGFLSLDANSLLLERREGTDTRRLSVHTGWQRQHITTTGGVLNLSTGLWADSYQVARDTVSGGSAEDTTGRLFPHLTALYRHPLVRQNQSSAWLLEPLAGVTLAANGNNPAVIANEDSPVLDLDDGNLFRLNRFAGRDVVSSGSRVDYGLNFGLLDWRNSSSTLFLGQSYRLSAEDSTYGTREGGLQDQLSDMVGRLQVSLGENVDFTHRFRLETDTGTLARQDSSLLWENDTVQLALDYLSLPAQSSEGLPSQEEISLNMAAWITPEWRIQALSVHDLENQRTRASRVGVTWYNQCLALSVGYERDFNPESGLGQDNKIMLRLDFAHLGSDMADYREKLRQEWARGQ